MLLRFGDCVLDREARELRRASALVPLSPKAFQLLSVLLDCRPRPRPQTELRDLLWPDTAVGYTSLAGLVAELRKSIGDSRAAGLIRTIPRYGYAFSGAATVEALPGAKPAAALVTVEREYPLLEGESLVGRGAECGVRLQSSQVSRVHARVRVAGKKASVEDMGSKNGTWVNGDRKQGPASIADGDEVIFGTFAVVFRIASTTRSTRTGRPR